MSIVSFHSKFYADIPQNAEETKSNQWISCSAQIGLPKTFLPQLALFFKELQLSPQSSESYENLKKIQWTLRRFEQRLEPIIHVCFPSLKSNALIAPALLAKKLGSEEAKALCSELWQTFKKSLNASPLPFKQVEAMVVQLQELIVSHPDLPQMRGLLNLINTRNVELCARIEDSADKLKFIQLLGHTFGEKLKFPPILADFYQTLETAHEKQRLFNYFCSPTTPHFFQLVALECFNPHEHANHLLQLSLGLLDQTPRTAKEINAFVVFADWILNKDATSIFKLSPNGHTPMQLFHMGYSAFVQARTIPTPLKNLYMRLKKLEGSFSREIFLQKLMANLFGISGHASVAGQTFELEGLHVLPKGHPHSYDAALSAYGQEAIEKLIQTGGKQKELLEKTLAYFVLEANDHYGYFFPQSNEHVISAVRFRNHLLIGNRGMGSGPLPGILIFTIDPDKFDESKIDELDFHLSNAKDEYNPEFFTQKFLMDVDADLLADIEFANQEADNCPWLAWQMGLFSLLLMIKTEGDVNMKSIVQATEECKELVHTLSEQVKEQVVDFYQKFHSHPNSTFPINSQLLQQIGAKAD